MSDYLKRNLLELHNEVKEPFLPKLRHIIAVIEEEEDAKQLATSLSELDLVLILAKEASDNKKPFDVNFRLLPAFHGETVLSATDASKADMMTAYSMGSGPIASSAPMALIGSLNLIGTLGALTASTATKRRIDLTC